MTLALRSRAKSSPARARKGARRRRIGSVPRRAPAAFAAGRDPLRASAGLERQADWAASEILAGRTGVAERLTRTPAADVSHPSSTGEALPPALRADLEESFGADLGAVRVHRGPRAAALAADRGADALVSGRDIFFEAGAYDPESVAGLELLLHELAHTVQQTGRRGSDGRLRVTPSAGHGPPQLQAVPGSAAAVPAAVHFSKLLLLHEVKEDEKLWAFVDREISPFLTRPGQRTPDLEYKEGARRLDSAVRTENRYRRGRTRRAHRSFLYDLLKELKLFDAATWLLKDDVALPSRTRSPEMQRHLLRTQGVAWLLAVVPSHPLLRLLWPAPFLAAVGTLLSTRGRVRESVEQEVLAIVRRHQVPAARANERTVAGFVFIADAARAMDRHLTLLTRRLGRGRRADRALQSARAVRQIAGVLKVRGFRKNAPKETLALTRPLGETMAQYADRVEAFHESIARILALRSGQLGKLGLAAAPGAIGRQAASRFAGREARLLEEPALVDLRKILVRLLPGVMGLEPRLHLPSAAEYRRARQRLLRALLAHTRKHVEPVVEAEIDKLVRKPQEFDRSRVEAHALVLAFVDGLTGRLYKIRNLRPADAREGLRLWSGVWVWLFAKGVGWKDVADLAARVVFVQKAPTQAGSGEATRDPDAAKVTEGRLALVSDWERQKTPGDLEELFRDLEHDFPAGITELKPLTSAQIVSLYKLVYTDTLIAALDRLLGKEEGRRLRRKKSILHRAQETAQKSGLPVRWIVREFAYTFRRDRSIDFTALLESHPKTRALQKKEFSRGRRTLLATFAPSDKPVQPFLWTAPSPARLIGILRENDTLNRMVATAWHTSDLAYVRTEMPWGKWLSGILETQKLRRLVSQTIEQTAESRQVELDDRLRRATTEKRRVLAKHQLGPRLRRYSPHDVRTWSLPEQALGDIRRFSATGEPSRDRMVQTAALLYEVASELEKAFRRADRYDIITEYMGLLTFAVGRKDAEFTPILQKDQLPAESWAPPRREQLRRVVQHLRAVRSRSQRRFGFRSLDGKTLRSLVYTNVIKKKVDSFTIDGTTYTILDIYRPFTYHPAFGRRPSGGRDGDTTGYAPPLFLDGTGRKRLRLTPKGPLKLLKVQIVPPGGAIPKPEIVTTESIARLDELSRVVEARGFQASMENLLAVIKWSVELVLDAAEFIPGVGQAVAVARLAAGIIHAIVSGEFEQVFSQLKNPTKLFSEALEEVSGRLQPDALWLLLIAPPLTSGVPAARKRRRRRRPRLKKSLFAQLGRALAGARRAGAGFLRALARLQFGVSTRFAALRGFVVTRPRLAAALEFAADNVGRVSALPNPRELGEKLDRERTEFNARFNTVLEGLQELKLPANVVPIAPLVEAIMATIPAVLLRTAKARAAWTAARAALEFTGAWERIARYIEGKVRGTDLDPNVYWRDKVFPLIGGKIQTARDALVTELQGALKGIPGLSLTAKDLPPITLAAVDEEEDGGPASAPYPSRHLGAGRHRLALDPGVGGAPLPPAVRARSERRFGHDFGHVRLHTGSDAADATARAGAEALTTGSHVYLRPGLSPDNGNGSRVLDHELTHVLQQTGPRSGPGPHDQRPRIGQPGRGLEVDEPREREAGQTARQVRHRDSPVPVDVGGRSAAGVQPLLKPETLRRILRSMSSFEELLEFREDVSRPGAPAIDDVSRKVAGTVWKEIRSELKKIKATHVSPAHLKKVSGHVRDALTADSVMDGSTLARIALQARTEKRRRKPSKKKKVMVLRLPRFLRLLQGYLFARTAFLVRFTTNASTVRRAARQIGEGKSRFATNLIRRVTVHGFALGALGGQAKAAKALWERLLQHSRIKDKEKFKRKVREVLRPLGAATSVKPLGVQGGGRARSLSIFTRDFRFTVKFVDYVNDLMTVGKGAPEWVPTRSEYVKTEPAAAANALRVGTHGALRKGVKKLGRESHHVPQYLLVQFFHGTNPNAQPFTDAFNPIGLEGTPDKARSFKASKGTIQFAKLMSGDRGDAMPAVLLARETHRRGGLHITKGAFDVDDEKPTRQSAVLAKLYERKLHERLKDAGEPTRFRGRKRKDVRADTAYARGLPPAKKSKIGNAVYAAIQDAYAELTFEFMLPRLGKALDEKEVPYYRAIAAGPKMKKTTRTGALQGPYDLRAKHMASVYEKVKANTETIMKGAGWKKQS